MGYPYTTVQSGLPTTRNHRTALVIDVRNGVTAEFTERYNRLLQSVNGPNIKVDVFTLSGNSIGASGGLVPGAPGASASSAGAEIDLQAWAKSLGYAQLLVVSNPKA